MDLVDDGKIVDNFVEIKGGRFFGEGPHAARVNLTLRRSMARFFMSVDMDQWPIYRIVFVDRQQK
jgi:hypothetical protein